MSALPWQRKKGQSPWQAGGGGGCGSSDGEGATFPAPCPWAQAGRPWLASACRWMFTKMDAGAWPVTCWRNHGVAQIPCAAHLFELTQATCAAHRSTVVTGVTRFYIHCWAQGPGLPPACGPFEGPLPSPSTSTSQRTSMFFFLRENCASNARPLSPPGWLVPFVQLFPRSSPWRPAHSLPPKWPRLSTWAPFSEQRRKTHFS